MKTNILFSVLTVFFLSLGASYSIAGSVSKSTLLSGIENKIHRAFQSSINSESISALSSVGSELASLDSGRDDLVIYWDSYLSFYTSIYYLRFGEEDKSEAAIERGIDMLEGIKNKDSDVYALLGRMQGFSIQFASFTVPFIAASISSDLEDALLLDSMNIRAHFVSGEFDFNTPTQFGGGKVAEHHLLRAISLPREQVIGSSLPSWGVVESYELLVILYRHSGKASLAERYLEEGLGLYPESLLLQGL